MSKKVFCDPNCRSSYIEDLRAGLIYGSYRREDGAWKNHRQFCEDEGLCPYCKAKVVSRRVKERFYWRGASAV